MRGKYDFEDKNELYYWMDVIEPALYMLESGELDEVDYYNDNLSPCLLGKVLESLGNEEGEGEFCKENLYVNYYNTVTHRKVLLYADIETFALALISGYDESEDEE